MLVKLTTVVNLIIILQIIFSPVSSAKKVQILKKLFKRGYTEKAADKMSVKLKPAVNFINVKRACFLYEHHFGSFFLITCT